jgi:hypothetical protein
VSQGLFAGRFAKALVYLAGIGKDLVNSGKPLSLITEVS